MRILVLTALLFSGAVAQSAPACLNTCLSQAATQASCSGATDAPCLCTQNVLTDVGACLSQRCLPTDLSAAEQAAITFCNNGAGNSSAVSTLDSQSGIPPLSTSRSATTSASASALASPSPSPSSNAATRFPARSGVGVIIAALGAFLVL